MKLNPSLGKTGPVVDENASVEAKKAKAKKERRKSLSDMCKVSGELQRKIEREREFCFVL